MRKIFLMAACLFGCMTLNSCLEFDEPGDELEMNQKLVEYENPAADDNSGSGADANAGTTAE